MTNRTFKSGAAREQVSLFPPRIEDYVDRDNPVRAIEAYVGSLDLAALGFRHTDEGVGVGQPPYHPADLLKLYIYGYLHRVRSSRRLEREACVNVEVMWLLSGLRPGYRTIGNFRKDNGAALKKANRDFVLLLRDMGLLGGELVAIDGAFFHGDASKGSIVTRHRLSETVVAVERDIEAYTASLETNDTAEDQAAPAEGLAEKLAALKEKHAELTAGLARLAESGETQLSRTDADARLLSKRGQTIAGYNVQIAVDDRHKLIVASEVVNDGNDTGQLHAMAVAAKEALGVETLQAAADTGYFNGETLKACEADAIVAYVPEPDRTGATAAQGRFSVKDFTYDAAADIYRCPAGAELRRMRGYKLDAAGKLQIRYASRGSICKVCPLRQQCLTPKARRRDVYRWEHQEVVERHRVRMAQPEASEMMSHRASLVEHPFGTLKCRAGYRHFLLRGFTKVRGEWSLMALCYNFTRVLSILGLDRFLAYLARNYPHWVDLLFTMIVAVADQLTAARRNSDFGRPNFANAT